jgi:hypothetical protein
VYSVVIRAYYSVLRTYITYTPFSDDFYYAAMDYSILCKPIPKPLGTQYEVLPTIYNGTAYRYVDF